MARNISYGTANNNIGAIDGLGGSSTYTAGIQWYVIDNSTDLAIDRYQMISWSFTSGSATLTAEVRLYVIASYDGTTWPDTLDGVAGNAATFTNQGVLNSVGKLAYRMFCDSNSGGNRRYYHTFSIADLYGGIVPKKCVVFWVHGNTSALMSSVGVNFYYDTPIFETI
jgi:hypothetical protein